MQPSFSAARQVLAFVICWFLTAMPVSVSAQAGLRLTNAAQIRALLPADVSQGYEVSLTATVTFSDTARALLFVQDATGGVFVSPQARVWDFRAGQTVRITGMAAQGSHLPFVSQALITDLGSSAMPTARLFTFCELEADAEDGNWICVSGVVRSAVINEGQLQLTVASEGRQLLAVFSDAPPTGDMLADLVDAEVSIQGVCGMVNKRFKKNGGLMLEIHAPNLSFLTVNKRFSRPDVIPISRVVAPDPQSRAVHRVLIKGALTGVGTGMLRVKDASGEVRVIPARTANVESNATVEVAGFPGGGEAGPLLEDATVFALALNSPQPTRGQVAPPSEYLRVLTCADDVRELPKDELDRGYPVHIQGVVTYFDSAWRLLFVEDKTAGIFVDDSAGLFQGKAGDRLEVTGFSGAGTYSPIIREAHFTKLNSRTILRNPRRPTQEQLFSGEMDAQQVEFDAIVRHVARENEHLTVRVSASGALLTAFVPAMEMPFIPTNLVDAEVAIRGVCGVGVNAERQLNGIEFYVAGPDQIRITKPAPEDPLSLPLRSIGSLMQYHQTSDIRHRIHVRGTVIYRDPRFCTMFIGDATDSLYVCTAAIPDVAVGDLVDVAGFINANPHGPSMTGAVFKRVGVGVSPAPIEVTPEKAASGEFDSHLITLNARYVEPVPESKGYGMLVQSKDWCFLAWLEGSQSASKLASLRPGSLLKITGVCSVQKTSAVPASSSYLWLRSPADVVVLEEPSWTRMELGVALGLMALVLTGTTGWVAMLRRSIRKKTADLRGSEAQLTAIYENTPIMMFLVNERFEVEKTNRAMMDFLRRIPGDRTANRYGDLIGCVQAENLSCGCGASPECSTCSLQLSIGSCFKSGRSRRQVEQLFCFMQNGSRQEIWVSASTALMRVEGVSKVLVCLEDITERKRLESQFFQAQKMEAVGQLAGGVAHDFNNILTAAIMNISCLRRKPGLDRETVEGLIDLEKDTSRAADLTRQLLLFSRRQAMVLKRLDVNDIISGLMKLLKRLLGENIEMRLEYSDSPAWIDADPGMIEQMVTNLCVNARDAMPKGGVLVLRVTSVNFGEEHLSDGGEVREGQFVCVTVEDTGTGMNEATMKRIFEPFFTTKEVGKGTGLGLATVYGIVKQHQGWVEVASVVDRGTTFRVYLPQAIGKRAPAEVDSPGQSHGGTETILFVEDDASLRRVVSQVLRGTGYTVLEARTGMEALKVWEQQGGLIHLLLTDVVMPEGMSGLDLAQRLRQLRPNLKVILSSGYSIDLVQLGNIDLDMRMLPKPYESETLVTCIRSCLDEKNPTKSPRSNLRPTGT